MYTIYNLLTFAMLMTYPRGRGNVCRFIVVTKTGLSHLECNLEMFYCWYTDAVDTICLGQVTSIL